MKNTYIKNSSNYSSILAIATLLFGVPFFMAHAEESFSATNVVELVNESRLSHGTGVVLPDALLTEAASEKARDMFSKQYFSHNTPDGKEPWYWIDRVGYEYEMAGENLAIHFSDARAQHVAWMESPLHRKNILNPDYMDIGVGVERGTFDGVETTIVVQFFGTRKNAVALHPTSERTSFIPEEPVVASRSTEVLRERLIVPSAESSAPSYSSIDIVRFATQTVLLLSLFTPLILVSSMLSGTAFRSVREMTI